MRTTDPHTVRAALLGGAVLLLAGCAGTLQADENGIVIEHSSHHAGAAQWNADSHCGKYGRKAVLVRKSPKQATYLFESNVSEYECVP